MNRTVVILLVAIIAVIAICILAVCCALAILVLMGPTISNVFSNVNGGLQ